MFAWLKAAVVGASLGLLKHLCAFPINTWNTSVPFQHRLGAVLYHPSGIQWPFSSNHFFYSSRWITLIIVSVPGKFAFNPFLTAYNNPPSLIKLSLGIIKYFWAMSPHWTPWSFLLHEMSRGLSGPWQWLQASWAGWERIPQAPAPWAQAPAPLLPTASSPLVSSIALFLKSLLSQWSNPLTLCFLPSLRLI